MKNLGTNIERIAKPIARGIDAIWGSDLAGCSGCSKMRDNLDAGRSLAGAFYDRFWSGIPLGLVNKEKGENMQFQIQIIVEAEGVPQAVTPDAIAKGTIISVTPRPAQPQRPQLPTQLTNMKTGQPVGGA